MNPRYDDRDRTRADGGQETGGERLIPDELEVGETLTVDGAEYVVEDVNGAQATLNRPDLPNSEAKLFRWLGGAIGFEVEITWSRDDFDDILNAETDPDPRTDGGSYRPTESGYIAPDDYEKHKESIDHRAMERRNRRRQGYSSGGSRL